MLIITGLHLNIVTEQKNIMGIIIIYRSSDIVRNFATTAAAKVQCIIKC